MLSDVITNVARACDYAICSRVKLSLLNSWRLEHCEVAIGNLVLGSTIRTFADLPVISLSTPPVGFCATALIRRQFLRTLSSVLPFLFACRNCSLGHSLALLTVESFRLVLGWQQKQSESSLADLFHAQLAIVLSDDPVALAGGVF